MRRSIRLLLLCTVLLFSMLGLAACSDLTQSTHTCLYNSFPSTTLGLATTDSTHDFITVQSAERDNWALDREDNAPFVKAYSMTYDLDLSASTTPIVLGKNVYIGICTHSASLKLNDSAIIASENSGLFLYDCGHHGCYAALDVTNAISSSYLTFAHHYATAKRGVVDETTNALTPVPFVLPAGSYVMNDLFSLTDFISKQIITLEDPANTVLCLNNQYDSSFELEYSVLTSLGVTIHKECNEPPKVEVSHECFYIPDDSLTTPLSQSAFCEIIPQLPYFAPSEENPMGNLVFAHLTESIVYNEPITIPDGAYFIVCKNGFDFDVKATGNLFVTDCTPHVCLHDEYEERIPLWEDGITGLTHLLNALHEAYPEEYPTTNIPLPDGHYALMEDFENGFPFAFTCDEDLTICTNGYTIAGKTDLAENAYVCDCTALDAALVTHACSKISPHITAIDVNMIEYFLDENGQLTLDVPEVAFVLTSNVTLYAPITIPTGLTVHLCLNGYTIQASDSLMETNGACIFFVEYAASLYVSDCSEAQSGGVLALTVDAAINNSNISLDNYAIVNLGTCVLNGGTYNGVIGIANYGTFIMKDGTVNGMFAGVMTAEADSKNFPLHSKQYATYIYGGAINALLAGVATQGDLVLANCTITATMAGVINSVSLSDSAVAPSNASINNVEINLTTKVFAGVIENELTSGIKETLPGVCGLISNGDVAFYGDLKINTDNELLEPIVTDSGLTYITLVDMFLMDSSCEIKPGVELTDTYVIYYNGDADHAILANQDVSDNFILMEGYAGMLNADGDFVIVESSSVPFINNAQFNYAMLDLDGYVCLNFYFYFDMDASVDSFLENPNAQIKISIEDEIFYVDPTDRSQVVDLGNNEYCYSLKINPKDYRNKVRVQFTNGQYLWTAASNISVETFLVDFLYEAELGIAEMEEVLSAAPGTYDEKTLSNAYATRLELVAYKNVILSMLNYCDAAAVHFGEKDEYTVRENNFSDAQPVSTLEYDLDGNEYVPTSVTQAMENITLDTFAAYKPVLLAGSKMPNGVKLLGITLLLDSGMSIRYYFQIDPSVAETIVFKINGETVAPVPYTSANTYYVVVENLSPLQMKQTYNVSITNGVDTYAFEYGVFSYMYGVMNNAESSAELVYLAKATWLFAEQMEVSFASLMGITEQPIDTNEEVLTNDENS